MSIFYEIEFAKYILPYLMRMLGEMAVEEPVSGSFSYYADKY